MYHVSTEGVDEHIINVHYYYRYIKSMKVCNMMRILFLRNDGSNSCSG